MMLAPRTLAELQWLQHTDSGLTGKMVAFDTVAGREIPANASSARDLEVELEPARRGWVAHGASWAISPMYAQQLHWRCRQWKGEVGVSAPHRGAVASGQSARRGR
jgi:hypothetical protein